LCFAGEEATMTMDDKARLKILETVLAQMLKPVKGVPFSVVIKSLAEKTVIKFDKNDPADRAVLDLLEQAIKRCADDLNQQPILRPRPNEVGNDIEEYVMRAVNAVGLRATRPASATGHAKSTGYPDILFYDSAGRPTYLECKISTSGTSQSTMRSFYLSPSERFKVSVDARHLLLAFSMVAMPVPGTRNSLYRAKSFKLVDLHDLLCDVTYEFNSDNRRLYAPGIVILQGNFP
jgi:hypothetical protein